MRFTDPIRYQALPGEIARGNTVWEPTVQRYMDTWTDDHLAAIKIQGEGNAREPWNLRVVDGNHRFEAFLRLQDPACIELELRPDDPYYRVIGACPRPDPF